VFQKRESVETETSVITLGKDDVFRHVYKRNSNVERKHSDEQTEAFLLLSGDKKYPCILLAEENVNFTKEYRERSKELENVSPITCFAAVTDQFAYRMIANFYLKFHKPKIPFRLFSTEQEALKWIEKKGYQAR
jgi:hypothetical protein